MSQKNYKVLNYFTSLSNWYIVHEVVKQRTSIRWICKTIKEMKRGNGEKYRLRIVTELKIEVICNNAGRLSNVKIYQKSLCHNKQNLVVSLIPSDN